ncbi:MAG: alpha/beta fold hydrolase [Actinomycetota bacterium]|nr:alpha/beta fold hydrolase [Actinomycetota bacterium]
MHVESIGRGPRVVFVHGSVWNGAATWASQRPLAQHLRLVVLNRPGFPPNPPVERVDFDEDAVLVAKLLEPGDHLVGHSYGGVIALLAAARRADDVGSLTVIEPPCFAVAAGEPAVALVVAQLREHWERGPREPERFLRRFAELVLGSAEWVPSPLPPALAQGARTLMVERGPWEAAVPLAELRRARFPKLVVSGGHHAAFDAVCHVLERRLDAEHAVLEGARHAAQRTAAFNATLVDFVERGESPRRTNARRRPTCRPAVARSSVEPEDDGSDGTSGRGRRAHGSDVADFRLLGPVEVVRGRDAVPLGGRKQSTILALLLLEAGRVVPADRLIDELWGPTVSCP